MNNNQQLSIIFINYFYFYIFVVFLLFFIFALSSSGATQVKWIINELVT